MKHEMRDGNEDNIPHTLVLKTVSMGKIKIFFISKNISLFFRIKQTNKLEYYKNHESRYSLNKEISKNLLHILPILTNHKIRT